MHERPVVVVFSGGGTGGHLYPALALADALVHLRPDVRPFFVGASRGVEARILPERGVDHLLVPVEGFQRGRGLASWRAIPALAGAVGRVAGLFRDLRPEAVVVTGGYAGAPAGLVAGAMGIPLVLQEQNAVPGITARGLSHLARRVHVAFPEAVDRLPRRVRARVSVSGNPVRPPATLSAVEARERFGVPTDATLVLVTGGSQGSLALNRTVADALRNIQEGALRRPDGLHLLWITGPKHEEAVVEAVRRAGEPAWVHVLPYADDMPSALAAADFAVSRAGAMTTAEFLNQGLPAILVPLPSAAADHQRRNAQSLEDAGAAVLVPEEGLTGTALWAHVHRLAADETARAKMRAAARSRARPAAAVHIAADVARLLPPPESRS